MIDAVLLAVREAVIRGVVGVAFAVLLIGAVALGEQIHEQPARGYDIAVEWVDQ